MNVARAVALALALVAGTAAARAQRGVDAELFHPALDSYGIFTVERAEVAPKWEYGVRLFANLAANPLRLTMSNPEDPSHTTSLRNAILLREVAVNLGFHLGLTDWLEVALDVPLAAPSYGPAYGSYGSAADPRLGRSGFYLTDRYTNIPPPNAAPLDARVGFKARIVRAGLFGLAAIAVVTLPFGDDSAFLGDSGFTFRPTLVADLTRGPLTIAINAGAIVRSETRIYDPYDVSDGQRAPRLLLDVGHELTWAVGGAYRVARFVAVAAEVYGLVPLVGARRDYTADALAGVQLFPTREVTFSVGGGAGFLTSADRRDDWRVFVGVSWTPAPRGSAPVASGVERDPTVSDRDGDGIPDAHDRCPDEPEDHDGFEDLDGCPDVDNDGDGIPDVQDRCPDEAEDRDGFEDLDGCPEDDNDGDGIPDAADKCPNEPETRNGVDDEDGCPDHAGQVVVEGNRVLLPDPIHFEAGRARIAARSEALLAHVADALGANHAIRRVRIEGHTDDLGSARANRELSQARADAVRAFLIARGVEPQRLQAVGFGDSRPLDTRRTPEARAKNRRVELVIVE